MKELDVRTVTYRLWRLRRLIGVSILLPLPGILFASLIGLGLGFGGGGGAVWLLWIIVVLGLAIRFPNGWVDHFALGLPLLAITFLSPFARLLGVGPILGVFLAAVSLGVAWLALNSRLPILLSDLPMGTEKHAFRKRLSIPAQDLRNALFLRPGSQCGLHACGPAGSDGLFQVRAFGYRTLDSEFRVEESDISFFAKVIESDESSQVTQYFLTEGGVSAGTCYQEITPSRRGCVYAKDEVHDHFSVFSAIGFWLNDVEADHLTATLDFLAKAPPRALKLVSQETLLSWVAQRVMERMAARRAVD